MIASLVVLALLLLLVVFAVSVYNNLVTARNYFRNAFAQIDVQLKRRYDLIPNLVEVAKGYLQHERGTLEAVIQARNSAHAANTTAAASPGDPGAMKQLAGAEATLGAAMGRFFALAEAYPDLKANTTMMQLSEELTSTENKVAFARQAYNDAVMAYNIRREQFPGVLLAGPFGFGPAAQLEVISGEQERQAPRVSFT